MKTKMSMKIKMKNIVRRSGSNNSENVFGMSDCKNIQEHFQMLIAHGPFLSHYSQKKKY